MLNFKEIYEITFDDVVSFCEENTCESQYLDYKREISSDSLAKTIAAMANTWGGLVVIGVEDQDSKPKAPFIGMNFKERLPEQINNIVLGKITPPVFPEVQVCKSSDGTKCFVIVRIAQSNLTPHAINKNTKVYIRSPLSNEPEELATIDRVMWLKDRRQKSIELRNGFYLRTAWRLENLCKIKNFTDFHGKMTLSICPLFPFDAFTNPRILRSQIISRLKVDGWGGGRHFPLFDYYEKYKPIQDGIFNFHQNDSFLSYTELNVFGYYHNVQNLGELEKNKQTNAYYWAIHLFEILYKLDLFLKSASLFYNDLRFWGMLEIKVSLSHLRHLRVIDLPAGRNRMRFFDELITPTDSCNDFQMIFSYSDLRDGRLLLVTKLFQDIAWGLGFSEIAEDKIKKIFEEYGHYKLQESEKISV